MKNEMNDDQIKACERSHAELENEHYHLVRTNPLYRLECQLNELALNHTLSNAEMYGTLEEPIRQEIIQKFYSYHRVNDFSLRLNSRMKDIEGELTGIRKKTAEMMLELDKIAPKKEKDGF